jgi:hypothetical protein
VAYARDDKKKLLALLLHWRCCRSEFHRIKRALRGSVNLFAALALARQVYITGDRGIHESIYTTNDFWWLLKKLGLYSNCSAGLLNTRVANSHEAFVRDIQGRWWSLDAICSSVDREYRRLTPHQRRRSTYPKRHLRKP